MNSFHSFFFIEINNFVSIPFGCNMETENFLKKQIFCILFKIFFFSFAMEKMIEISK